MVFGPVCSILENVPRSLEKNVYFSFWGWRPYVYLVNPFIPFILSKPIYPCQFLTWLIKWDRVVLKSIVLNYCVATDVLLQVYCQCFLSIFKVFCNICTLIWCIYFRSMILSDIHILWLLRNYTLLLSLPSSYISMDSPAIWVVCLKDYLPTFGFESGFTLPNQMYYCRQQNVGFNFLIHFATLLIRALSPLI